MNLTGIVFKKRCEQVLTPDYALEMRKRQRICKSVFYKN